MNLPFVAANEINRVFELDAQLLMDVVLVSISMFVMYTFLSYLLFNPVRNFLEKRKQGIQDNIETAKSDKEEALKLKQEYEMKLKEVDKEAEAILAEARKKSLERETEIVNQAKEEATRIINRANNEIVLEKKKAVDEMKQELIAIASLMAGKFVEQNIDQTMQDALIDETLKEMGEHTWLS